MSSVDFALDTYHRVPGLTMRAELVLFSIADHALKVLMIERDAMPHGEKLVLPGGYLREDVSLMMTAEFLLMTLNISSCELRQFELFSAPDRDPRGRCVSAAYLGVARYTQLLDLTHRDARFRLVTVENLADHRPALSWQYEPVACGFDHEKIVASAVKHLKAMLYTRVPFGFLPGPFTLFELQRVHEVILGHPLEKVAFRKRVLARQFEGARLRPISDRKPTKGRPARLYNLCHV